MLIFYIFLINQIIINSFQKKIMSIADRNRQIELYNLL